VDADTRRLPERVGRRVRIAGLLEAVRDTQSQTGRNVRFLTLDDECGLFEVTAFLDGCRMKGRPSFGNAPAIVAGRVDDHYGALTVSAERVEWYDEKELAD